MFGADGSPRGAAIHPFEELERVENRNNKKIVPNHINVIRGLRVQTNK